MAVWLFVFAALFACPSFCSPMIKCYQSPHFNHTGNLSTCPKAKLGCSVTAFDDSKWFSDCSIFKTQHCIKDTTLNVTTCFCNTTGCNKINSPTFRRALNRQQCYIGKGTAQCDRGISTLPKLKRCNSQDEFSCAVSVEGEKGSITYKCIKDCSTDNCKIEKSEVTCCCKGNNCNNKNVAERALKRWCSSQPTTTTKSAPPGPKTEEWKLVLMLIFGSILLLMMVGVFVFCSVSFVCYKRANWRSIRAKRERDLKSCSTQIDSEEHF